MPQRARTLRRLGLGSIFVSTVVAATVSTTTSIAAPVASAPTLRLERASASELLPSDYRITAAIGLHYRRIAEAEQARIEAEAEAKAAEEAARQAAIAAEQAAAAAAAQAAADAAAAAQAAAASADEDSYESSPSSGSSSGSFAGAANASGPAQASANIARTVVNGDIVVTQAGTVLDAVDVHGRVIVKAANVTISNSIVRGDGSSQWGLIDATAGAPGLKVYYTEVFAASGNPYVNGVMGYNFELHGVDIHDVIDQVDILGDNVVIDSSNFHNNLHYDNDPQHSDGSHDDNVQIQQGSNIRITNNTFSSSHNAGVQVTQDSGSVSNLVISGNRITQGGCSINIAEKGRGPVTGVTVSNNVLSDMKWAGCGIIADTSTSINNVGNVFGNGAAVGVTPR